MCRRAGDALSQIIKTFLASNNNWCTYFRARLLSSYRTISKLRIFPLFCNLLLSLFLPKYRILRHRYHHRRSFHICGTAEKRRRYALFRTDGARSSSLTSFPRNSEISKRGRESGAVARPAFTAIYRSISYVGWIRGGFSRVLRSRPGRATALRLRILRSHPRSRPPTEVDRARNVPASRFCLKRKFYSRIHLMQDAQSSIDYLGSLRRSCPWKKISDSYFRQLRSPNSFAFPSKYA